VFNTSVGTASAAEWQAEAQERELEKVALRHIKAEAKAAERTSRAEVDVDAVRQVGLPEHACAVHNVCTLPRSTYAGQSCYTDEIEVM
jgi:hypothetical protein